MTDQAAETTRVAPVNMQSAIARGLANAEAASATQPAAQATQSVEAQADVAAAKADAAGATDPTLDAKGLKKLPERKPVQPQGNKEHMIARLAKKEERAQAKADQARYEAELQKAREEGSTVRAKLEKISAAFESGDVDQVVQLVGFENFEAAQKRWLENRGAIPKSDPRVSELEKELKTVKEREAQRARQEQEAREAQELAALQDHYYKNMQQQLRESGYEKLPELAEKPWFVNTVLQLQQQDVNRDEVEIWSDAYDRYEQFFKDAAETFGYAPKAKAAPVAEQKRTPSAATGLPRTGTAETSAMPSMPDTRVPGAMLQEKPPVKRSPKEVNDARNAAIGAILGKLPQSGA